MNKLIQVNIGGIVFQIDEQAYQQLDAYLNSIKKKYASTSERDEIVKDIEARIAEIFSEKYQGVNAAIMQADVDEIISVMGKPEDFESTEQKQSFQQTENSGHRASRFYRDKDNSFLGGVCAGFAAKFGVDALWIRLAFLIVFFFAGTGLLLYIILWIIIPEAKTTAEKLEMRGEKVNISNIEKTVKEGASQFTTRINEFGQEVKQTFSNENVNRTKKNAGDFIESGVETLKPAVRIIVKIIVFAILIVCLILVFAILVGVFANWDRGFSGVEFLGTHIMKGSNQAWLFVTCALALVIIPLMGIIISSVKYLLNIKAKTKFVSVSLAFLWTGCFIAVVYTGIMIGRDFRYEDNVSSRQDITQPDSNTFYLKLDRTVPENFGWDDKHGRHRFEFDHDSLVFEQIHLHIEKSADSNFQILVNKSARGYDRENARANAQGIRYQINQSSDSVLIFPALLNLIETEPWRHQEVFIILRVPENHFIYLDPNMEPCLEENEYTAGLNDAELYNTKLIMTSRGLSPLAIVTY